MTANNVDPKTKELDMEAIQDMVANLLAQPESQKLEEEMNLAWDMIPDFGLDIKATPEEVAAKIEDIGQHAASIFPGVVPPPHKGLLFMFGEATQLLTEVRDCIMFTQELEKPGMACGMITDSLTLVKVLTMVMATHMFIRHIAENTPDKLGENPGQISGFRYFSVLSQVINHKLLILSEFTWKSKEEIQKEVEESRSKIIIPQM